ncbi:hypothetical protein NW768_007715 [Fusarium equiseti]|uniref:Uncharacterized protein n=1 Tax=Fusarium equiseti TaxID=61235 RepID=A0ABQ8R8A8_FUSEQ|nr:hypothetical protein NW768_007715 [Fusarium equiseti]
MAPLQDLLAAANKEFADATNNGPYSSYQGIQLLLGVARKSVHDLVRDPKGTFAALNLDLITRVCGSGHPALQQTWNGDVGRCTDFALRIADRLTRRFPDDFQFEHFHISRPNKQGHRLSRCAKTGIVVDILSDIGVFTLWEKETKIITTDHTVSWKLLNDKLSITYRGGVEEVFERVSQVEAQAQELHDVARFVPLVVHFRDFDLFHSDEFDIFFADIPGSFNVGSQTGPLRFPRGIVKWNLQNKQLTLRPDVNTSERSIISWHETHTEQDARGARLEFAYFVAEYGGPYAEMQWKAGHVDGFFYQIWKACDAAFGKPKVIRSVMGSH